MVEIFNNSLDWILSHYKGLVTFFTSAQFASIAGLIILLIKQGKKIKKNTDSSDGLQLKIVELEEVKSSNELLIEQVKLLQSENKELKASQDLMNKQLSLFFEAQTILYSTHRNEDTRANLMRIATKARTLTSTEDVTESIKNTVDVKTVAKKVKAKVVKTAPTEEVGTERY